MKLSVIHINAYMISCSQSYFLLWITIKKVTDLVYLSDGEIGPVRLNHLPQAMSIPIVS